MSIKLLPDLDDFVEDLSVTATISILVLSLVAPEIGRELLKTTIKGGFLFYKKSKKAVREIQKTVEESISEAQAELASSNSLEKQLSSTISTDMN